MRLFHAFITANEFFHSSVKILIKDKKVADREFGNSLLIEDNHPKIVVSMDEMPGEETNYKGIRHLHIKKIFNGRNFVESFIIQWFKCLFLLKKQKFFD